MGPDKNESSDGAGSLVVHSLAVLQLDFLDEYRAQMPLRTGHPSHQILQQCLALGLRQIESKPFQQASPESKRGKRSRAQVVGCFENLAEWRGTILLHSQSGDFLGCKCNEIGRWKRASGNEAHEWLG